MLNKKQAVLGMALLTGCTQQDFAKDDLSDEQWHKLEEHREIIDKTRPYVEGLVQRAVSNGTLESDPEKGSGDIMKDLDVLYTALDDVFERKAIYRIDQEQTRDRSGYSAQASWFSGEHGDNCLFVDTISMKLDTDGSSVPLGTYLHEAGHIFGIHSKELEEIRVKLNDGDAENNPSWDEQVEAVKKDNDFSELLGWLSAPYADRIASTWLREIYSAKRYALKLANNLSPEDWKEDYMNTSENRQATEREIFDGTTDGGSQKNIFDLSTEDYRALAIETHIIDLMREDIEHEFNEAYREAKSEAAKERKAELNIGMQGEGRNLSRR